MEPIFKKCLGALTMIHEQALPAIGESYKRFNYDAKKLILENQCLNESRKFTKAAIEAQNSGMIENGTVKGALAELAAIDEKLDNRSRYLNDLLGSIKDKFTKRSKSIMQKNHHYLNEMKNGDIPAEELLVMIVTLGKDIQKVMNEEVPAYMQELSSFIDDAESRICDDAYRHYNKVMKLDKGTFPAVRFKEWTYLPDSFLRTSGAFVNDSYMV